MYFLRNGVRASFQGDGDSDGGVLGLAVLVGCEEEDEDVGGCDCWAIGGCGGDLPMLLLLLREYL